MTDGDNSRNRPERQPHDTYIQTESLFAKEDDSGGMAWGRIIAFMSAPLIGMLFMWWVQTTPAWGVMLAVPLLLLYFAYATNIMATGIAGRLSSDSLREGE